MAKLYRSMRVLIDTHDIDGKPAAFILRTPTNEELNDYEIERYGIKHSEQKAVIACRVKFFDKLLAGIEDLNDVLNQPIGLDRKDLIPDAWKNLAIVQKFEMATIEIKNF